jgi:mannose-6-phosphate isomerase-like protein (cupin superfamily)
MSFSKQNLNEVEDSAPKFGYEENQEARFAREDLGAEDIGLSYHVVRAGKRQGFAHRHEKTEEIYVILSGSGRMKLDDELIEVGPMDAVRVEPEVLRAFEAGSDGLEILAFGLHHAGDGELVHEGFWES